FLAFRKVTKECWNEPSRWCSEIMLCCCFIHSFSLIMYFQIIVQMMSILSRVDVLMAYQAVIMRQFRSRFSRRTVGAWFENIKEIVLVTKVATILGSLQFDMTCGSGGTHLRL